VRKKGERSIRAMPLEYIDDRLRHEGKKPGPNIGETILYATTALVATTLASIGYTLNDTHPFACTKNTAAKPLANRPPPTIVAPVLPPSVPSTNIAEMENGTSIIGKDLHVKIGEAESQLSVPFRVNFDEEQRIFTITIYQQTFRSKQTEILGISIGEQIDEITAENGGVRGISHEHGQVFVPSSVLKNFIVDLARSSPSKDEARIFLSEPIIFIPTEGGLVQKSQRAVHSSKAALYWMTGTECPDEKEANTVRAVDVVQIHNQLLSRK
jgi:hypothetical protein